MLIAYLIGALLGLSLGVPIQNGLVGQPEITCGATELGLRFVTEEAFEGKLYVKGLHRDEECRSLGDGSEAEAGLLLPFESCGLQRLRSLSPRGVFVRATVILSFHPLFLTKVDRAVRVECFYMEADKTVETDLSVSMLTTGFVARQPEMPVCRYELFDGGPDGPVLAFAEVGAKVYHKWTCESLTDPEERFCALVHSCGVEEGSGRRGRVALTDERGCTLDRHLLPSPTYDSALSAFAETHAFKYADLQQLYFQCQVSISVREPGQDCQRPQCDQAFAAVLAAPRVTFLAPVVFRLPTKEPNDTTTQAASTLPVTSTTESSSPSSPPPPTSTAKLIMFTEASSLSTELLESAEEGSGEGEFIGPQPPPALTSAAPSPSGVGSEELQDEGLLPVLTSRGSQPQRSRQPLIGPQEALEEGSGEGELGEESELLLSRSKRHASLPLKAPEERELGVTDVEVALSTLERLQGSHEQSPSDSAEDHALCVSSLTLGVSLLGLLLILLTVSIVVCRVSK